MKRTIILVVMCILFALSIKAQTKEEEFNPYGKVKGVIFYDYYYKIHADSLNRGQVEYSDIPKDYNAFELRRIFLGHEYHFSEKFSTDILLAYEEGALEAAKRRTVYIRSAHLRWKDFLWGNDLLIGHTPTPTWTLIPEKVWGYRSIEKTIADMRKSGRSNDLGIMLQNEFKINEGNKLGYNLMLGNATGAKLEVDHFKIIYAEIYGKLLKERIIIDLYTDFTREQLSPFHKSRLTYKVFTGYQTEKVTFGIETFQQRRQNYAILANIDTSEKDTTDILNFGLSIFLRGEILKDKLGFFVRGDIFNPDVNFNPDKIYFDEEDEKIPGNPDTERFFVAGIDYTPLKNIHIMPNIWVNAYNSRSKDVSGLAKQDYDLVARITLWLKY